MSIRLQLERKLWDAQRFGVSPSKLVTRMRNRTEPRIHCVTLPKAGTHLLERTLCLHPQLYRRIMRKVVDYKLEGEHEITELMTDIGPGQIVVSHLFYRPLYDELLPRLGIKNLFMVRDLRDVTISRAFYIPRQKKHNYHKLFLGIKDPKEMIKTSLLGKKEVGFSSMRELMDRYYPWLETDYTKTIRFEMLVGASGGGSDEEQFQTISEVYRFIGLPIDVTSVRHIARNVFSDKSPTFRRGAIGKWRDHFDEEITDLFKEHLNDYLIKCGYVQDDDW